MALLQQMASFRSSVCVCVCVGNRQAYILLHNRTPPLVVGGIKAFTAHEFIMTAFLAEEARCLVFIALK